jgi:hypothetical protein
VFQCEEDACDLQTQAATEAGNLVTDAGYYSLYYFMCSTTQATL